MTHKIGTCLSKRMIFSPKKCTVSCRSHIALNERVKCSSYTASLRISLVFSAIHIVCSDCAHQLLFELHLSTLWRFIYAVAQLTKNTRKRHATQEIQ